MRQTKHAQLTVYVYKDGSKEYRCGACGCMWASVNERYCPKCQSKFTKQKEIKE